MSVCVWGGVILSRGSPGSATSGLLERGCFLLFRTPSCYLGNWGRSVLGASSGDLNRGRTGCRPAGQASGLEVVAVQSVL